MSLKHTLITSILAMLWTGPTPLTAFDALLLFVSLCCRFLLLMETFIEALKSAGVVAALLFDRFLAAFLHLCGETQIKREFCLKNVDWETLSNKQRNKQNFFMKTVSFY